MLCVCSTMCVAAVMCSYAVATRCCTAFTQAGCCAQPTFGLLPRSLTGLVRPCVTLPSFVQSPLAAFPMPGRSVAPPQPQPAPAAPEPERQQLQRQQGANGAAPPAAAQQRAFRVESVEDLNAAMEAAALANVEAAPDEAAAAAAAEVEAEQAVQRRRQPPQQQQPSSKKKGAWGRGAGAAGGGGGGGAAAPSALGVPPDDGEIWGQLVFVGRGGLWSVFPQAEAVGAPSPTAKQSLQPTCPAPHPTPRQAATPMKPCWPAATSSTCATSRRGRSGRVHPSRWSRWAAALLRTELVLG